MNKKIIMAAGGSGGHLFPALSAADCLKNENFSISFCGVDLEKNPFFLKEKYEFKSVFGSYFSKKKILTTPLKLTVGFFQALKYLIQEKPKLVIGFGSYHSFPAMMAAAFLRIPYVLFEPNLEMGKVNLLFKRQAKKVMTYFDLNLENQIKILPPKKYKKFSSQEAKKSLGIDTQKPVLLILGGSQGSLILNESVMKLAPETLAKYFIIHIVGKKQNLEVLENFYRQSNIDFLLLEFTDQMQEILSITQLAISRAGASSLYELMFYEIPTLFIPYGDSKSGHQVANAKYFCEKIHAGNLLLQSEISQEKINQQFSLLEENHADFQANLIKNKEDSKTEEFEEFIAQGIS